MVLSNTQKVELHKSILGYLKKNGFEESYQVFKKAAGNLEVEAKHEAMLETKWRSIVRLQKKDISIGISKPSVNRRPSKCW